MYILCFTSVYILLIDYYHNHNQIATESVLVKKFKCKHKFGFNIINNLEKSR